MNEHQTTVNAPHYARPSFGTRMTLAACAVACSSTVICAGLGLFEMRAQAGAALAPATLMSGTPAGTNAAATPRPARRG